MKKEVALAQILESARQAVKAIAEQNQVKILMPLVDSLVIADAEGIVLVLRHLLSNAIKYSPKDSEIVVAYEEDDSAWQLKVIDRGAGIASEQMPEVLERFEQDTTKDFSSSGADRSGLAICLEIVLAHDGTIVVESEEGKGSTFGFQIPKTANFPEN